MRIHTWLTLLIPVASFAFTGQVIYVPPLCPGTGCIFYDNFPGSAIGSQWTVIQRHGEYAQNENECNVASAVTVSNHQMTITTDKPGTAPTCGDTNIDGSVRHSTSACDTGTGTPCPPWPYTSGDVQWTNFNFTYGTVSAYMQFPASSTITWPAIWMLGSNCQVTNPHTADTGYSTCPAFDTGSYQEIDMVECWSGTWCQTQIHTATSDANCTWSLPDTNFHLFKMVWSSGSVVVSMDGTTECTISNSGVPNGPMFLLIQNQTCASTGCVSGLPNNSQLPTTLVTNYVQVTQP